MSKFKIGDKVRIKTLTTKKDGELSGVIGHEGIVSDISTYDNRDWYRLHPYVIGGNFPAECLERIRNKKKSNTLFNIEDL